MIRSRRHRMLALLLAGAACTGYLTPLSVYAGSDGAPGGALTTPAGAPKDGPFEGPPAEDFVPPAVPEDRLGLYVAGGFDGFLAEPACRSDRMELPLIARLGGTLERARAAAHPRADPLVLVGDVLGTGSFGRSILETEDGGDRMVDLLGKMNPAIVGLGNGELHQGADRLRRYLKAARTAGMTVGSSNLVCEREGDSLCENAPASAEVIQVVNGRKIGFVAVQAENLRGKVDEEAHEGISFSNPVRATTQAARRLRAAGAKRVVAVVHRGSSGSPEGHAASLAEALIGEVDVVIADAVQQTARVPRVAYVGDGLRGITVINLRVRASALHHVEIVWPLEGPPRARVSTMPLDEQAPLSPSVSEWLQLARDRHCDHWGGRIGETHLEEPMSAEEFQKLTLHVMRDVANAQIAVINRGAFETRGVFPLKSYVSLDDLHHVFRFDNDLVVYEVDADDLEANWAAAFGPEAANRDLLFIGVEARGETLYINGREIDPDLDYSLVTIGFLARGGDEALRPPQNPRRVRTDTGTKLAQHVRRFLEERPAGELRSTDEIYPNLWDRPLWRLSGRLDAALESQSERNGPGYRDLQLTGLNALSVSVLADARLAMSTRHHSWNNRFRLAYSEIRSPTDAEDPNSEVIELINADVGALYSSYGYRALRDTVLNRRWFGPILSVLGRYRFEVDQRRGSPYRQSDLNVAGGIVWEVGPLASLTVGAGVDRVLLRARPYNRRLLMAAARVDHLRIVRLLDTTLYLEAEGDIRLKGRVDDRQEFYGRAGLSLEVLGPLEVYARVESFSVRARGPLEDYADGGLSFRDRGGTPFKFAQHVQLTMGLSFNFQGSKQWH